MGTTDNLSLRQQHKGLGGGIKSGEKLRNREVKVGGQQCAALKAAATRENAVRTWWRRPAADGEAAVGLWVERDRSLKDTSLFGLCE